MGNCPSDSSLFNCITIQQYYANMDNSLPSLGINPDTITVSGFAAGALMAD
jgi:hypothetical protein